jgi:AcrR family transcriptional regulator
VSPVGGAPAGKRTGRRPGSEDTRATILGAARDAFGERGFDGSSIRDIAARAGVDAALVHHYFGSKQRLFIAASEFPVDVSVVVPRVLAGPVETMGERFVRATMLRTMLAEGPLGAIAGTIGGHDAPARAALAGSQLVGLVLARYVVAMEPIASMTPDELAASVGPTIGRYLVGETVLPVARASD